MKLMLGDEVGADVGSCVGVKLILGDDVGANVGSDVGRSVGACDGVPVVGA